jgi:hypothetical protein
MNRALALTCGVALALGGAAAARADTTLTF